MLIGPAWFTSKRVCDLQNLLERQILQWQVFKASALVCWKQIPQLQNDSNLLILCSSENSCRSNNSNDSEQAFVPCLDVRANHSPVGLGFSTQAGFKVCYALSQHIS